MTLEDFYAKLKHHDWFFEMSDDHRVFTRGLKAHEQLLREADTPEKIALYRKYRAHVFSGPAFGTEKKPKPELNELEG